MLSVFGSSGAEGAGDDQTDEHREEDEQERLVHNITAEESDEARGRLKIDDNSADDPGDSTNLHAVQSPGVLEIARIAPPAAVPTNMNTEVPNTAMVTAPRKAFTQKLPWRLSTNDGPAFGDRC